ncbi:MAG: GntR family transcriptional regulator [Capsulimonadaceae bacterium]|nr:GntR family transcriptional regulator [Capsulimonadaceae bacterium]
MTTPPSINLLDIRALPDRDRDIPLHVQVRRVIRNVIEDHFEDGQQFWTEQALSKRMEVSLITVRRALSDLASDGILVRRPAKGTFVRKPGKSCEGSFRVSLFVARHHSEILSAAVKSLAHVCHERKLRLQTYYTFKGQRISDALDGMEHGADQERVILLGQPRDMTLEMLDLLSDRGYRAISVDTTVATDRTDYVGFDERAGMEVALAHLTGLGHRRITLLVNEPENADSVVKRVEAFRDIASRQSLATEVVSSGTQFWESAHDAAYRSMPAVWKTGERPTAILTVSDAGAWAALKWLADNRVRVPDEVSVMGFDDDRLSPFTSPSLTTLGRDMGALAESAMDVISEPIAGRREVLLQPFLIERMSTAVPPDAIRAEGAIGRSDRNVSVT